MMKRMFLEVMNLALNRRQIIRLSRALMDKALGDNNDDMENNGELFLLHCVLSFLQSEHEFVAFDIGANVGQWTTSLLDIAENQGVVGKVAIHCFEPSSFTFSKLQSTLSKHRWRSRTRNVNLGIGSTKGAIVLYINENGAGTNSLYKRRLEGLGISFDRAETVQITTVDDYCRENNIFHINFMKIDVEGHELAVTQGAMGMLKKQAIDYIQFEYGGCWIDSGILFMDMYDLLISLGYVIGKIMPKGVEFYEKYDQRLETFQMANFLACKQSLMGHFKCIKPWWVI
jgi:FkbM family methyltransferase